MKYIDADKLKAEIERRIAAYQKNFDKADNKIARLSTDGRIASLKGILPFIASLQQEAEEERRKRDYEMQKTSIEYCDLVIKHIEAKRVLPSFKGQLLHDFKNELNTMKQILDIQNWSKIQYTIFEKVALAFAAWGGYHFHPKESLPKDERQQEQPEVDLEKEIDELWKSLNTGHEYVIVDSYQDFLGICLHCFELGLNARKEE